MKIDHENNLIDVFGLYWVNGGTFFLGMPKNHGGLIAYSHVDVKVVDPFISNDYVFYSNSNISGIYHADIINHGLLDGLLELDPVAYNKFISLINK